MTAAGEAGVGDPLAALPLPLWHPDPLRAAAAAQRAAAAELGGVAQRQAGVVAGTVGSAWIGAAAASCGELGRRLAAAHDAAARHSEAAAQALDACAAAWEQARDGYQRARHIADEAMREEQAQRAAAGPAGLVAGPSTSPLRTRAVALASRAIDEFQLAARRAATELDVHTHVLAPAQPPPPPPRHHAKPWYQGAFGWLGDRGQDLAGAGRSLLGFGGYAATHPGQTAGIVADIGGMAVGLLGMAAGAGGEAGGAVLDATGIGLPIGIPVNVASAGLIATGATVAGVSAVKANHDLGTMWAEAQSESSGGAEALPKSTAHGTDRLAGRGFTAEDVALTKTGRVLEQDDGATVYVKETAPGRYNVIVEGDRGVVTALKNIRRKAVDRLATNYGWKGWP